MPPRNRKHFAGASSTIKPEDLSRLGPAFMVQPKMDGAYCHVHLGPTGCIQRISSKTGRDYGPGQTGTLIGQFVGYPGAVLVGELTAHTEAGVRDAAEFGAHRVHVFDMAFGYDSRPLVDLPYSSRRSELLAMQEKVRAFGPGQTWEHSHGRARDKCSGRFAKKTHRGTALTPVVPQVRPDSCSELWDRVKSGELEGLVAVAQNAPLGRRNSKRKCKLTDTLDAMVLSRDARVAQCFWMGRKFLVQVGGRDVCPGDIVAIKHNGWYEAGKTPRFARIDRIRHDLAL